MNDLPDVMRTCSDRIDLAHYEKSTEELFFSLGFQREVIVSTPGGDIAAWSRDAGHGGPTVYLSSGIHGDEPAGPLAIESFLRHEDLGRFNWLICPVLNPAGVSTQSRYNQNGLDLNRDYFVQQSDEARSHAAWLERQRIPDLFLSLHEDWETEGFYFYEISLGVDQPQRARGILDAVKGCCPIEQNRMIDDHVVRELGWIHHEPQADFPDSWPEAIFLAKRGCPLSFTFETPSCAAPLEKRIAAHRAAICASLQWMSH